MRGNGRLYSEYGRSHGEYGRFSARMADSITNMADPTAIMADSTALWPIIQRAYMVDSQRTQEADSKVNMTESISYV